QAAEVLVLLEPAEGPAERMVDHAGTCLRCILHDLAELDAARVVGRFDPLDVARRPHGLAVLVRRSKPTYCVVALDSIAHRVEPLVAAGANWVGAMPLLGVGLALSRHDGGRN